MNQNNSSRTSLEMQVMSVERAFANTMAERDFEAFAEFIDEEAIFIEQPEVLQGKQNILAAWQAYFDGVQPPFSWEPEQVDVLASGTLAFSSGPVFNPAGIPVARFNSIWRLSPSGAWKIVFDKGSPVE